MRRAKSEARRRPWLGAAGAAVVLSLAAAQAFGAGSDSEAVPGGPPACSVLAEKSRVGLLSVDLWVQCNYRVSELVVRIGNRKLDYVPVSPELVGADPSESMTCGRSGPRRAVCKGRLKALVRFHAGLTVDEGVCRDPRLRLRVYTSGGPECTGDCPGAGFWNWTPSPTNRRTMGCFGN